MLAGQMLRHLIPSLRSFHPWPFDEDDESHNAEQQNETNNDQSNASGNQRCLRFRMHVLPLNRLIVQPSVVVARVALSDLPRRMFVCKMIVRSATYRHLVWDDTVVDNDPVDEFRTVEDLVRNLESLIVAECVVAIGCGTRLTRMRAC